MSEQYPQGVDEEALQHGSLLPATMTQQAELPAIAAKVAAPELTPAQARVEAVSNLLHKAYEKASTLALTPEESKALQAEFADSDFRTGAGGKENLIYIEHAALRQRLNEVFGLGQWSLVVRNRWGEDYQYFNKTSRQQEKACRIYVEACLLVRGCFVAEAIGDMVYYPANQQTNYGDAVEGAKSAALRRCAKELGVGLQAWRKDFCESWMKKHAGHRPTVQEAAPVKPAPAPAPKPANVTPMPAPAKDESAADRKARFIAMCKTAGGGSLDFANELFRELGTLLPNETMDDLPEDKVPATRKVAQNLLDEIKARAGVADDIPMGDAPKPAIEVPRDDDAGEVGEWWRDVEIHFGKNKGTKLGELEKSYLFGWWANWQPKEYKGQISDADAHFRKALDAAGEHYEFKAPEEDGRH